MIVQKTEAAYTSDTIKPLLDVQIACTRTITETETSNLFVPTIALSNASVTLVESVFKQILTPCYIREECCKENSIP